MATFANNIDDICGQNSDVGRDLRTAIDSTSMGNRSKSSLGTSDLGGLHPDDFFLYTHNYTDKASKEYVTYKLKISDLEYLLYKFRLRSLSTDLLALFELGELAKMNVSDLHLGNLALSSRVLSSDIVNARDIESHDKALPLSMIDVDWEKLIYDNLSVLSAGQKFGDLAFCYNIGRTNVPAPTNNSRYDDRWFLNELVRDAGSLATMDKRDLGLSDLAYVKYIDLDANYGKYLVGQLDFKNVKNYRATISSFVPTYIPLASDSVVGGIKTGSKCPTVTRARQYPIKMDGQGTSSPSALYVEVPWVDTNTYSTYTLCASGTNTLIFTEYDVDNSLLSVSTQGGTAKMDIRKQTKVQKNRQTVTFTPYIERNIILSPTVEVNKPHKQCLARFSSNQSHLVIEEGPSFSSGNEADNEFLTHKGDWKKISTATTTTEGLMTAEDKKFIGKMKQLETDLNGKFYELSAATASKLGGIKVGCSEDSKNGIYPVKLDNNDNAYVQVPNQVNQYQSTIGQIADNSISEMLKQLYPVGAIYITVATTCPLATLISGSTWTRVSQGRCLWGYNGSSPNLGTNIEAGLPNHWHTVTYQVANCECGNDGGIRSSHSSKKQGTVTTTAASASNNIYGKSTTVQPPAFVVNIFMRTK